MHKKLIACSGSFGEKLASTLDLPKDALLNIPRITAVGNQELVIEGHQHIAQYTDQRLRISVYNGEVVVAGQNLTIKRIAEGRIWICGEIKQLEFCN